MDAELTRPNSAGPLFPRAASPTPTAQRTGNSLNHDALNHNRFKDSFNPSTHTHYHQHFSCPRCHHSNRDRGFSFTPTLASVASDDSSTTQGPPSPISAGIPPIKGRNFNQNDDEHATRVPVVQASNEDSLPQALTNPDPIDMEGRIVHQDDEHRVPVTWTSEASNSPASTSQRHAVKRRSRLFTSIRNLSAYLGQASRKSLWLKPQPTTHPERLKLWTELNIDKVDDYLPPGIGKKYKIYMRSPHLSQTNAIPVWNPTPFREVDVPRRKRIDVGDVGTFTRRGGFRVAFNILMSEKTNKLCGYDVPKKFSRFRPPLTPEQEVSCSIKDDGPVIDLDYCGAIIPEPTGDCPDVLSHGFQQRACRSSRQLFTTGCNILPEANEDNKWRGYVLLPHGAKIFSFNSKASKELNNYLNEGLQDWLEYLDGLWHREHAPPIIVTSVWAARSFACATYTVNPPNTSAVAQVWTTATEDRILWAHASEGFETARAPQPDGYDGSGKLISQVEDQCFGIEGYVLKSRKAVTKLRASLMTM